MSPPNQEEGSMTTEKKPDTTNAFMVAGSGGGRIAVMNLMAVRSMSADDALLLAAWLVAMAEIGSPEFTFEEYLAAVKAT